MSRKWLGATVMLGAALLVFSVINYQEAIAHPITASSASVVQLVTAKVLLYSVAVSAVIWCGRIYRANRHNYVVNEHRQNALSSFETFAQASGDDQTKNSVLLQATKSIFEPQPTGFVDSGAEPQPTTQLIQMWKAAGGGR